VRLVAATNKELRAAVAQRRFREDLYFRLSVFPITIPPLRERKSDILTLARFFVERFCRDLKKKPLALSPSAIEALQQYAWPGNVRELQNCIERAVILAEGDTILPRHLNLSFMSAGEMAEGDPWDRIDLSGFLGDGLRRVTMAAEQRMLANALREAANNKPRAAELLGVSYKTFLAKLKEYRIE
jgi:DNA-binding NtrC family response regulator